MNRDLHNGGPPPDRYDLAIKNVSGEEIPACGFVRVTDGAQSDEDAIYEVDKPDGSTATYWINAPSAVADDEHSAATNCYPATVAYDDAETPAVGEEWGPVSGSWLLTKSGSGYMIVGTPADGLVRVEKLGGGGGAKAIVKTTASIDAATDSGTRVPETSTDYEVIKGSCSGEIENWAMQSISSGAYLIIVEIAGDNVISVDFC